MSKITLKQVRVEEAPIVQKIFESSPEYFRRVDGSEVEPHFAKKEIQDIPKKLSATYKKVFLVVYLEEVPIGVVDFHKDHPAKGQTYIGLLLLDEKFHGSGLGKAVYEAAENYAKSILQAQTLVLGVSERNNVQIFWEKMGFKANGKTYEWKGEKVSSTVIEMEKLI